ncbi:hypothetical protein AB9E20_34295, partial [Rhizobium leguminosarum]
AATDLSAVEHTKIYLVAFEEELAKVADSTALKAVMEARFPGLGMGVALDIGSKVAIVSEAASTFVPGKASRTGLRLK